MARLVKHKEHAPVEIKGGPESKWACMCGLSKNRPYCDGGHKRTKDEDETKTYVYDDEKRVELK